MDTEKGKEKKPRKQEINFTDRLGFPNRVQANNERMRTSTDWRLKIMTQKEKKERKLYHVQKLYKLACLFFKYYY